MLKFEDEFLKEEIIIRYKSNLDWLISSYNHVSRRFLTIAWLSLDMRNIRASHVIESLDR